MNTIWAKTVIDWKNTQSWTSSVSRWVRPHLNLLGIRHLRALGEQEMCWDDSNWLALLQDILKYDVDHVVECLGEDVAAATALTYHGCRTKDASAYHQQGLLRNDPTRLEKQLRRIVEDDEEIAQLYPDIERAISTFDARNRDLGRLYLALDDRALRESGGHYLIYGSEWMQCLLGWDAHLALRRYGIPTIFLVNLGLEIVSTIARRELARSLLQEWVRIKVNKPNWVPKIDFSFCIARDIPFSALVGHYHPETAIDPFYGYIERRFPQMRCPSCK